MFSVAEYPFARRARNHPQAGFPQRCPQAAPAGQQLRRTPVTVVAMTRHKWDPIRVRPDGLVRPVRLDPSGRSGPTRGQSQGPHWDRVGDGWYAPVPRPDVPEQRILDASCRLAPEAAGAVTGWASLLWQGASFFDGLAPGGVEQLPVPLMLGVGSVRPSPADLISKRALPPREWLVVDGLPVATIQRALFDEIRERGELWAAVEAIEMAAAARLISPRLFAFYLAKRKAWTGVPLARQAVALASGHCWSPPEVRMGLSWELLADLPRPLRNQPIFTHDGRFIAMPDLFDPESGTCGEYDGEDHKDIERHRSDVAREDRLRFHGLEYFTVVRGDSRAVMCERMVATRRRARFVPEGLRSWTLDPPPWWQAPEPLDAYLLRTGRAEQLIAA